MTGELALIEVTKIDAAVIPWRDHGWVMVEMSLNRDGGYRVSLNDPASVSVSDLSRTLSELDAAFDFAQKRAAELKITIIYSKV